MVISCFLEKPIMIELRLIFTLFIPLDDNVEIKVLIKLLAAKVNDLSDQLLPLGVAAFEAFAKEAVLDNVGPED